MDVTPAPIRLGDLAAPVFPPEATVIMDAGAALVDGLEPSVGQLCAAATARCGGLDDFGPDGWQDTLEVLCSACRDEAGLWRFGLVSIHTQLVQFLTNRLLGAAYLDRHPEALQVPVRAPIVTADLPRTGTTHLHNLMSADPALRSLPYWESVEPLPAHDEPEVGQESILSRVRRCQLALDLSELWIPELKRMHEMTA